MRSGIVCSLILALVGAAQAQGLRMRVVDAESGKPLARTTVKRWASQWQPRILQLPGKFWFPGKEVTADAEGRVTINKVAGDDWYAIKAVGYEEGNVARSQGKYRFTPQSGGTSRELAAQSGVVIVPLRRSSPKSDDRKTE